MLKSMYLWTLILFIARKMFMILNLRNHYQLFIVLEFSFGILFLWVSGNLPPGNLPPPPEIYPPEICALGNLPPGDLPPVSCIIENNKVY